MEVTRQLLTNRADKKGRARIQITFCWAGQRLRLSSGQKCRPQDWDAKRERAKAKPGTYLDDINTVLNHYTDAATAAEHAALMAGRVLDPVAMKADIEHRYTVLLAGPNYVPPPPRARPLTFLEHLKKWVEEEVAKRVSRRTGKLLTRKNVASHRRTYEALATFSQAKNFPLSFASIDSKFYTAFLNYYLGELGRAPVTFNHHLKTLRGFLAWAEEEDLPVNRRFRRVLQRVESTAGVDSLTQDELLRIAAIDFQSAEVQTYLAAQFPEHAVVERGAAWLPAAEHHQRVEYTRDKFLLCAYTALRISDADRLQPHQLHGDVARVEAGKTGITCIIPLLDDDVFKPAALLAKYAPLGLATCLPYVRQIYSYLPHIQHLASITRLRLGMHTGRRTFATLKIYQGVPRSQVMLVTGHQTEASFNRYLGIDEAELLDVYRKTARRL